MWYKMTETIDDVITIYKGKVYQQHGDLWISDNKAYLLKNVQYAIPFPNYRNFLETENYNHLVSLPKHTKGWS